MKAQQSTFQTNSKLSSIIQSNCQYLTFIRHNVSPRTEMSRKSYLTLEEYMKDCKSKLNYGSLLQLIIELAYFLYACKIYHVNPMIDFIDLRIQENNSHSQRKFSLVIWYKVQQEGSQQVYVVQIFVKLFQYIQEELREYLQSHKEQRDGELQQLQQQEQFQLFRNQFKMLVNNHFFLNHQSLFFLCLEQTSMFYQKSILYRIKNCSVLDFMKIDQNKLNLFRVAKVKDESLVIEYNKLKNRINKIEQEQSLMKSKQQQIQCNIREFFKAINEKSYLQLQTKIQKDQPLRVKFNFILNQRSKYAFEEMLQSMQGANVFRNDSKRLMQCKRIPVIMQYFIEYFYQKNQIYVKLYNQSTFSNAQIQKFLIFRSNVFTFESLSINIQLSQPRNSQTNDKKQLVFKGSSSFFNKQPPLQKILLLMDLTMIVSKIYETEINMNFRGLATGKDYQRVSDLSKKIYHYIKLFHKCAKKIYSG